MTTIPAYLQPIYAAPVDERADMQLVPMRDRVRLATDIYLPDGGNSFVAILIRLPYDKCGRYTFMPAIARYLNANGFAAVIQDVRGKFRSEGTPEPFVNEAADGYDTIEWLTAQPWSNGVVGMLGDSYYGFTQWAAVSSGHPALGAIVPRVTGSLFMNAFQPDRVQKIPILEWCLQIFAMGESFDAPVLSGQPVGALAVLPAELEDAKSRLLNLIEMSRTDNLLARPFGGKPPVGRHALPVLHTGGWFDNLQKWQLDDWVSSVSSLAGDQFLRMGINDHEDFLLSEDGIPPRDHEVDDDALRVYLPRMLDEPISFFRHYLSDGTGIWEAPRVRYRVAYAGWEVCDRWVPDMTETLSFQLVDGTRALDGAGGARLVPTRGEGARLSKTTAKMIEWTHDPFDPVSFLIESEWGMLTGLPDESEVHTRGDVATFTSDPMDEPLDLLGPAWLTATVDADAPSTHVIARLLDVSPDGSARFVLEGAERAQCGDGPALVRVRLGDTAYRLRPGHRLRLALSTSCFPQYVVHPGTDELPLIAVDARPTRQRLVVGGGEGLRLDLRVRRAATA